MQSNFEKDKGIEKILIHDISDNKYNDIAIEAIKKYIIIFTEKMKEKFSIWLTRSGRYIELMKEILREKGVPEEMVFIPLIESGFSPYAYSPKRAVGYWQFMSSTAKKYGLKINWWLDERRDPIKSTRAAADYLKDLYDIFGSWHLAIAAYNAGEGRILKALHRTKTEDYWELLKTRHIKKETKNYVPKFIAACLIANNPQDYGFDDLEYNQPINYDEVKIYSPIDIKVIAKCADTTIEDIKILNPELRRWCTPPDVNEYILRIPQGKKEVFFDNLSNIPKDEMFSVEKYKVKRGDTLIGIARKKKIPVKVIRDLNSNKRLKPLIAGSEIYIPPKGKYILDRDDKARIKKLNKSRKRFAKKKETKRAVKKIIYREDSKNIKVDYRKI